MLVTSSACLLSTSSQNACKEACSIVLSYMQDECCGSTSPAASYKYAKLHNAWELRPPGHAKDDELVPYAAESVADRVVCMLPLHPA